MSNKSAAGTPAISLPQGGGAVKGVDESFKPNPFTGTANFSVPIATTPGRDQFGPELALQYSSGSGSSPYGLGWSLSIPQVARKTERGIPRYAADDVFVLSGSEDLVAVGTTPDQAVGAVIYEVTRYRPRIEGLFARIELWRRKRTSPPAAGFNDVFWKITTKANVTSIYGRTQQAMVADPADPGRIFQWLLELTYDSRGNYIHYAYRKEDGVGIASAIYERNRAYAQTYIKRILYGNLRPLIWNDPLDIDGALAGPLDPLQHMFMVLFDYGEHGRRQGLHEEIAADLHRGDLNPWDTRPDPFSSCRAGFEIRTHRRCKRVLMFHNRIPSEIGPVVVRSTDLSYQVDDHARHLMLVGVTQRGYKRAAQAGAYQSEEVSLGKPGVVSTLFHVKSIPPLEFRYTEFHPQRQRYQPFSAKGGEMPPAGLNSPNYALVDLFGTGLPDVAHISSTAALYWRNLGNGEFDRPRELSSVPAGLALDQPGVEVGDMNGNGLADLLLHSGNHWGMHEATGRGGWRRFRPYPFQPSFSLTDPTVRLVDVTGDGRSDALRTDEHHFTYFPCLGEDGFGKPEAVERIRDLDEFPDIFFGDPRVRLADMNGDGLQDIVLVHNGRIDYYPSRGYGRFGKRITMGRAPYLGADFDPARLFLVDFNGDGLADLAYVDSGMVRFCFNQSGNAWSDEQQIKGTPKFSDRDSVRAVDMLGSGTPGILWSTDTQGSHQSNYLYVDLTGGVKPYVLAEINNNLGAVTKAHYASSAQEHIADFKQHRPWLTTLPFPVQVLKKMEVLDQISRSRLVTTYRYHHGYFDGPEREFRGFGMVEQRDTEEIGTYDSTAVQASADNFGEASFVPPVLTKTWFHTGAFDESGRVSRQLEREYYREPGLSDAEFERLLLPDTILPTGLSVQERREACRSLKGSILRLETFSEDGTERAPHPYRASERNYAIRVIHAREAGRHGVFLARARELVDFYYERALVVRDSDNPHGVKIADPRVCHELTLRVDPFGHVERAVTVAYPRRAVAARRPEQTRAFVRLSIDTYASCDDQLTWYRAGAQAESRVYEVFNLPVPASPSPEPVQLLNFDDVDAAIEALERAGVAFDIPYEDWSGSAIPSAHPHRRLVAHMRTFYRKNDLSGPSLIGEIESQGLPFESHKLAFTPTLLAYACGARVTDPMLTEAGYVHSQADVNWWVPSGRTFYSSSVADTPALERSYAASHFFLPHRFRDAFGNQTTVTYDNLNLLMTQVTDPVGNSVLADYDFRVMQPRELTDPNGNRSAVAFDALGIVVATATMGRPDENLGDSMAGFNEEMTLSEVDAFFAAPRALAVQLLGPATTRTIYDIDRHHRLGDRAKPSYSATIVRETHASDLAPNQPANVQVSFSYSDGFGREIQRKTQAESGPLLEGGQELDPRWRGSGWILFNNKGKPIRQYEPFFAATHDFEFARRAGVGSVLFYDPLERVVATLHPNHTYEKVVFDPWQQETWDVNDTIHPLQRYDPRAALSLPPHDFNPGSDPDAGRYLSRLAQDEFLPTWYDLRMDLAKALAAWPDTDSSGNTIQENSDIRLAERKAAQRAARHAATPTRAHLDSLGREFLTIADNGLDAAGVDRLLESRVERDLEGNQRRLVDAMGREVMVYDYEMSGSRVRVSSLDAGMRWTLNDVADRPIYRWDDLQNRCHYEYDAARRPIRLWLMEGGAAKKLVERTVYGEVHPYAAALKLRKKVYLAFDAAGLITSKEYDFKGNLLHSARELAREYRSNMNWAVIETWLDVAALNLSGLASAVRPLLEDDTFNMRMAYDALNRPLSLTTPDASVARLFYNQASLLRQVNVNLRGAIGSTTFVRSIAYNARSQREKIVYGNGASTIYKHDPLSFRLSHLQTLDGQIPLQDLRYAYDPVGNVSSIRDAAQQTIYFNGEVVPSSSDYLHDALYRLIAADGREHIGQLASPQTTWNDAARINLTHPHDGQAMRRYSEEYEYDEVGNILNAIHHRGSLPVPGGSYGVTEWLRNHGYHANNRLRTTTVAGAAPEHYAYDAHGNTVGMPHLQAMHWDYRDQLCMSQVQAGISPERTFYVYGADGHRVRKITVQQGDSRLRERIYVGGFEVYREYDGTGSISLERETLHVTDGKQRFAVVESRTAGNDGSPLELVRYQLTNHLGSACLELDTASQVVSYEEYYPYGCTSYQAVRSQAQAGKRYRYSSKERDEETGLLYFGVRYCAPWIGRWISCDPKGVIDGMNLYLFVRAKPLSLTDPTGCQTAEGGAELSIDPQAAAQKAKELKAQHEAALPRGIGRAAGVWSGYGRMSPEARQQWLEKTFPHLSIPLGEIEITNCIDYAVRSLEAGVDSPAAEQQWKEIVDTVYRSRVHAEGSGRATVLMAHLLRKDFTTVLLIPDLARRPEKGERYGEVKAKGYYPALPDPNRLYQMEVTGDRMKVTVGVENYLVNFSAAGIRQNDMALRVLESLPFAVGAVGSGGHTFVLANGRVLEQHIYEGPTSTNVFTDQSIAEFFSQENHDYRAAVIAVPREQWWQAFYAAQGAVLPIQAGFGVVGLRE